MYKIALADWFLSRSEAFRLLLTKFRNHKLNTKRSFYKVKQTHNTHDKKLNNLHRRVRVVETILREIQEETKSEPKIIKKNK